MRVYGLTGGIASGKSLVASRLAELGAVIVDADVLAREAVAPGSPALAAIAAEFGPAVIAADGSLDRAAMGALVFADAGARARLNAIVHPEVRRLSEQRFARAAEEDPGAVVVYDIPLLAEAGPLVRAGMDGVIVVVADEAERVRRMVEDRGMTPEDARARIASQATDEQRLALASHVIDNSGSRRAALARVDELWGQLLAEADVGGRA